MVLLLKTGNDRNQDTLDYAVAQKVNDTGEFFNLGEATT